MTSAKLLLMVLLFTSLHLNSVGFLQHSLWKENASLVASIRVASFTVFSPVRCLGECMDKKCTLMTLAVTKSGSGERIDCHLTKVTDWLNKAQVYLAPCNQTTQISCKTFVGFRMSDFYFPLDAGNKLRNFGTLWLSDKSKPTLRYSLGYQSGNPFTCTGPSGNSQVKYLLNNADANNYLIIDLNEQWVPAQGLTLAIWVMFPGSSTVSPIFEFYTNDQLVSFSDHFWFFSNPGQLYVGCSAGSFYGPPISMTPGQWYHVAMTWKPGGELLFYWNASQVMKATNGDISKVGYQPSYLLIGARPHYNNYLQACLAHAIIYAEAMNQSQLQHLMMTQLVLP